MLKTGTRSIISLIIVFTFYTCIDPYTPKLRGYDSLLVVDGLITDENTSYTVNLSRTMQDQKVISMKVTDATVYITDGNGSRFDLTNSKNGVYKTSPLSFKGVIGQIYTLHISTSDANEYESEPSTMLPVPEIDSIYFDKKQEFFNNGTETSDGLMIYLDSREGVENNYYRWDFAETWKFKVPYPKKYDYINDSTIIRVANVKEICWKTKSSEQVLVHSFNPGENTRIKNEPICFIDPAKSDRLLLQYSILIKQYSISKNEYDFWNNLKMVNETGSDIFATQPFSVISNIHNINNKQEQVLGYFRVSAVKQKRKNIPYRDIAKLNLPYFSYPCERIEMAPKDYPWSPFSVPLTWDDLYEMYCKTSDYYFVEPIYIGLSTDLDKLVFALPECANCELTGISVKPDFWTDLK